MCCEFFRQRRSALNTFEVSSTNPVDGFEDKMSITFYLDVAHTQFGIPPNLAIGDNIRFTENGQDIKVRDIIQVNGNDAIVINLPYSTYGAQANIYYI